MSEAKYKAEYTFIYLREEGLKGITTAALLRLGFHESPGSYAKARELFEEAVGEWLAVTGAGKEAWASSGEDFNIGDFMSEGVDQEPSFQEFTAGRSFDVMYVHQILADQFLAYDRIMEPQEL